MHDDDRSEKDLQNSRQGKTSDDRVPKIKEARDKFLRRKALVKQTADKQKKHYVESSSPDDRDQRKEPERSAGASGNKRDPSGYDNFGSFFFFFWQSGEGGGKASLGRAVSEGDSSSRAQVSGGRETKTEGGE